MGDRNLESDENKKTINTDATNLNGHSMSQPLPCDEIEFDGHVRLEKILNTPNDSDIGHFLEVDPKYPNNIKEKNKRFPFCSCEVNMFTR